MSVQVTLRSGLHILVSHAKLWSALLPVKVTMKLGQPFVCALVKLK